MWYNCCVKCFCARGEFVKKIIVIGCPGSGKSTFSLALYNKTNIPVYHLDMMFWNKDKTTIKKEIFLEKLSNIKTI